MGFRMEIRKESEGVLRRTPELVKGTTTTISLSNALELIVFMFTIRGRRPVQVVDFGPGGVEINYPFFVGLLGDKPLIQPDFIPGYSGSFSYKLVPLVDQDYDQLIEMIAAYLFAYSELGSKKVNAQMQRVKTKMVA